MATGSDEWDASGEEYQSIFDVSPHAILVHDIETKTVIEVNDAACDLLGTDRDDLIGAEVGDFSPDGEEFTTERAETLLEQTAQQGSSTVEWQITRPDGRTRWVQVQLRVATITGTERLVAYLTDITEQKARERRLEENDAILSQLTETTDDVFWLFDADFSELLFINDAYEEVWGRSTDDLREDSMDFMQGVHPDDRETVMEAVGRLGDGKSSLEEYRVNPEEDYERWVSVRGEPIFDDDGELVRAAGYARDITDRKERERQVQALGEATQELALAQSPDAVAEEVVDIADRVLDQHVTALWRYNDDATRLESWTATDRAKRLADQSGTGNFDPIEAGTFEMDAFQQGEPVTVDDYSAIDNPSSTDTPLDSLLLLPIGDRGQLHVGSKERNAFSHAEQNLLTILASNAETAFERAEREKALETYKNKLERSNENLQEFAYVASHDLQEPLRSVTSYLDLLETEYRDVLDEDAKFYIERVTSNAEQMSTLIDALLEYSRVKTDEGEFVEVDTAAVFDETVARLQQLIEETDADITVESLPTVVADHNQLSQVFQNLVTNAIDHGGDPPTIAVSAEETDGAWEFHISDNGPGIPESQHDRIFEIFQQANTDGSGEAGIGLAICERIVTRHGGDIWVESDGDGSTFKFTLPKRSIE